MSWTWGSRIKRKNKQDRSLFITEIEDKLSEVRVSVPVGAGGTVSSSLYSTRPSVSYPYISYANGFVPAPASETQESQKDFKNPLVKNKEIDWEKVWEEKRRAIDLE